MSRKILNNWRTGQAEVTALITACLGIASQESDPEAGMIAVNNTVNAVATLSAAYDWELKEEDLDTLRGLVERFTLSRGFLVRYTTD